MVDYDPGNGAMMGHLLSKDAIQHTAGTWEEDREITVSVCPLCCQLANFTHSKTETWLEFDRRSTNNTGCHPLLLAPPWQQTSVSRVRDFSLG